MSMLFVNIFVIYFYPAHGPKHTVQTTYSNNAREEVVLWKTIILVDYFICIDQIRNYSMITYA